jgi:hypothetical protein
VGAARRVCSAARAAAAGCRKRCAAAPPSLLASFLLASRSTRLLVLDEVDQLLAPQVPLLPRSSLCPRPAALGRRVGLSGAHAACTPLAAAAC